MAELDFERKHTEDLQRLREFRLLDDDFMSKVFEDKVCVQLLLQIILNRKDLNVQKVHAQHDIKNLQGRSIRLDIIALDGMLMYGKEAINRKQEIDRQHHTIPYQRNQRPKDKHRGNVYNLLFRHGKVRSQNMEKLKCSFSTFCKQTFPQLHKTASYAHYAQCRLLRNPSHPYIPIKQLAGSISPVIFE